MRSFRSLNGFRLSKWYLDCVSEAGDASIIYTGDVDWHGVRIHYSSLLDCTSGRVTIRRSLRRRNDPELEDGLLSWRNKPLHVSAAWRSSSIPLHDTIFENTDGAVEWNCVMPWANARICQRSGLGYVEHVTLTVPPWTLPIRKLRWGRFTSNSDWIVWIDWVGECNRRIAFVNGEASVPLALSDGRIEFAGGLYLEMDCSLTIRDGALGSTVLSSIPGVRNSFPARLFQIRECKWRSRARFGRPGLPAIEGWAIHEAVGWPE